MRRSLAAAGGALVVGLLLAGCAPAAPKAVDPAAAPTPAPARTPTLTPPPAPVPVQRATLPPAAAPTPPVAVAIETLGISLPVEPVGVRADGQMDVPPQAEVAGWYRFGAAPGDPAGTAVLAAHVDSVASAGLGPFARLKDLAPGDVVAVTRADGAVVRYAVTEVASVAKPAVAWDDVFVRDGAPRLALVTCGGAWQEDRRSYSDNVVVTAEPLDG